MPHIALVAREGRDLILTGKYLHDRLDRRRLCFWCYLLLTAAALKLLYDAVRALAA